MAKTPYFNKRRWLESRQDEITELYRTGKSWHEIVEHLKIWWCIKKYAKKKQVEF